jgi:hypothetical protein
MVTDASLESDTEANETRWEFSLSSYTYLDQHTRDHVNPNFTADRDWLHLEARYNYEALKTGSVWLGYNLNTGKKPQFEVTPIELTCRALTPSPVWRRNSLPKASNSMPSNRDRQSATDYVMKE